jgi:hypothetical protein
MFTAASLITFSSAILNSKLANSYPCRTPFLILIGSDNVLYLDSTLSVVHRSLD